MAGVVGFGLGLRPLLLLCCAAVCVSAVRREYFLRIEEVQWNYAPSGMNLIQNRTLQQDQFQFPTVKRCETHTYTWYLTKTAGPTEQQESCTVMAYYSTVDMVKDMYSGLIGPLVVCRSSWGRTLGLKKEVEEFAALFMVFDENESWYLDDNIRTQIVNPPRGLKDNELFIESNKMHAINGRMYGNLEGLNMVVGDKVYWYLMGMGSEVDIHSAHWHGHSVEYKMGGGRYRTDVYDLFPATFQTVKMRPEIAGSWLMHCHVSDHISGGMEAIYTVREKAKGARYFVLLSLKGEMLPSPINSIY
ncbi:unnamed protein product [Arctogadus glacialis]